MTAHPLRINYVSPLPSLAGGIKSTRLICEALVRRGHDVRIIFPTRSVPLPPLWRPRSRLRAARSRASISGSLRDHHLKQSTATLVPVDSCVLRSGDVPDADVTIASWWECVEWIMAWPASKGVRVHYIRGHEVFHHKRERVIAVYRSGIPKITNSHWLRGVIKSEYDREAEVVQNGVDWNQFGAPPRKRNRPPVVGFMCGRGSVKGAGTAMQACQRVQESIPDLRVVSFGASPIERGAELPRNFTYRARPPQDEIPRIYAGADCWLIPSTSEGLPMPGLEAAACRCPLIATECGGVMDFVREGVNGFLVPVGDWSAMAERIQHVATMPDTQWSGLSEASYQVAREFNWDKSAELLEDYLHRLLAGQTVAAC